MTCEVRRITDYSDRLAAEVAALVPQLTLSGLPLESQRRGLQALLNHDSTLLFGAFDATGHLCGMLTLVWYDLVTGRKAWIEDVVVDATMRRSGVATALLREALAACRGLEVEKVRLTSRPSRREAHLLYLKEGFNMLPTNVFGYNTDKE